uniref:K-box domain-containing protein n=1 Tax=Aegilops tauschii subsp. strangulata TaxID=200361 RepID=A0A453C240_AEGTS
YMYGENDINHMNLNELQALESNLEIWVHNIRYTKVSYISYSAQTKIFSEMIIFNILPLSAEQMQIISREIEMLKTKVGSTRNFIPLKRFFELTCRKMSTAIPFTSVFLCLFFAGRHTEGCQ